MAFISSILNLTPPSPDEPINKCVRSYAYILGTYVYPCIIKLFG